MSAVPDVVRHLGEIPPGTFGEEEYRQSQESEGDQKPRRQTPRSEAKWSQDKRSQAKESQTDPIQTKKKPEAKNNHRARTRK